MDNDNFEYTTEDIEDIDLYDKLCVLGNEGWELCSMVARTRNEYHHLYLNKIVGTTTYNLCVFKRKKIKVDDAR